MSKSHSDASTSTSDPESGDNKAAEHTSDSESDESDAEVTDEASTNDKAAQSDMDVAQENATETRSVTEPTADTPRKIKPNTYIQFRQNSNDAWSEARIESRAGKATGKYASWWNMINKDGIKQQIDIDSLNEWKVIEKPTITVIPEISDEVYFQQDERLAEDIYVTFTNEEEITAKQLELDEWKNRRVYTEVSDDDQDCISVRWVLSQKVVDANVTVKARLCAHGFEEEKSFRTDSPTCSREGI